MKWSVTKLMVSNDVPNYPNTVVYVAWRVQSGAAVQHGTVELKGSFNSFIPYESLKESDVLDWVWAAINRAEVEANVIAMEAVASQGSPASSLPLPWNVA